MNPKLFVTLALFLLTPLAILEAKEFSSKPNAKIAKAQARIYSLSSMTVNKETCTKEGASVLGTLNSKFFILKNFGDENWGQVVYAVACMDKQSCKEAFKERAGGDWIMMFTKKLSDTEYEGEITFTGFAKEDKCEGPRLDQLSLKFNGPNQVTLIQKSIIGKDYPPPCSTATARKITTGQPCSEYTVIIGKVSSGK